MSLFKLSSDYKPTGDQPQAIDRLVESLRAGNKHQTLLGVTGSGKTFTMANVIARLNRPALVMSHNKTLAAQLYSEFKNFFPDNAVEYFVSYYDYYQPEAYIASSDTYIEKDSSRNDELERLRIAAASSLVSRRDVIVVASVSCIYGLGSPEDFAEQRIQLRVEGRGGGGDGKTCDVTGWGESKIPNPKIPNSKEIPTERSDRYDNSKFQIPKENPKPGCGATSRAGESGGKSPHSARGAISGDRSSHSISRQRLLERLVENLYERNDHELKRGTFRVRGDVVDVMPAYLEHGLRVEFFGDDVESLSEFDPLTGRVLRGLEQFDLYPANQYVTSRGKMEAAVAAIKRELDERVAWFESRGKLLEAQRVRMRTNYDLEMLQEMGFCNGIENYSMHMAGRRPGERPFCLLDFFPEDFLLFVDESHATVPQIGGMFNGDRARKQNLVDHGFRLPSALENRPQSFEEFERSTGQTVYVSATPARFELERSAVVAEQLIRPTGLLDPEIVVRPIKGQVEDLIAEAKRAVEAGERVLVTTLTKRLSEDLTAFLREQKIRVEYLHSDIDAIERVEILRNLRLGNFDVLVGINLLREGLDLPEVALVAILDADKEGFLRSETSLIQTAGRAARHEKGRVIFYADVITESIRRTMEVTNYRREKQLAFNREHGITPRSVSRAAQASLRVYDGSGEGDGDAVAVHGSQFTVHGSGAVGEAGVEDVAAVIAELEVEMTEASAKLEFERAAVLRDQIEALRSGDFRKMAGTVKPGGKRAVKYGSHTGKTARRQRR